MPERVISAVLGHWGEGWRNWQPNDEVESTAGMHGTVVKVNVPKRGGSMGTAWVRVKWENGAEGRITPTNVRRVQLDDDGECVCPPDLLARGGFKGGCPVHA